MLFTRWTRINLLEYSVIVFVYKKWSKEKKTSLSIDNHCKWICLRHQSDGSKYLLAFGRSLLLPTLRKTRFFLPLLSTSAVAMSSRLCDKCEAGRSERSEPFRLNAASRWAKWKIEFHLANNLRLERNGARTDVCCVRACVCVCGCGWALTASTSYNDFWIGCAVAFSHLFTCCFPRCSPFSAAVRSLPPVRAFNWCFEFQRSPFRNYFRSGRVGKCAGAVPTQFSFLSSLFLYFFISALHSLDFVFLGFRAFHLKSQHTKTSVPSRKCW